LEIQITRPYTIIIGAGLAGASTAYHLTRMGLEYVIILERESLPGIHASSQNAAMIRQVVNDESNIQYSVESAEFFKTLPQKWGVNYDEHGSLLLLSGQEKLKEYERAVGLCRLHSGESYLISREQAQKKHPFLEDWHFDHAVWTPGDGVVDVHQLLLNFISRAKNNGAELHTNCEVIGMKKNNMKIDVLETNKGEFRVRQIINAGGAWAGQIARMAGAMDIRLTPYRRHIFVSEPLDWVDPSMPILWDLNKDVYFRPESGGLLFCPCDEEPYPPGIPIVDQNVKTVLAEKLLNQFPEFERIRIRYEWAGLRTFSPDRRFVIGSDPQVRNFFWVAGLGGHGVTVSYSVGKHVAESIMKGNRLTRLKQSS